MSTNTSTIGRRHQSLTGIIFVMCCIPNINFLFFTSGINNQPISVVLILVYYLFHLRLFFHAPFVKFFVTLVSLCFLYFLIMMYYWVANDILIDSPGFYTYNIVISNGIKAFISYLVGPLILIFFIQNFQYLSRSAFLTVVYLQLAIVIIQISGLEFLQNSIAILLDLILVNYNPTILSELVRGSSGTYVEPSHLSRYAILFMIVGLYLRRTGELSITQLYPAIVAILIIFVSSQAITGIAVLVLLGLFVVVKTIMKIRFRALLKIVLICIVIIIVAISIVAPGTRFYEVYSKLDEFQLLLGGMTVLDLQIFGGIRLVNMVIGYKAATLFPFGQGLGSYFVTMYDTAYLLDIPLGETGFYRALERGSEVGTFVTKPQGVGAQYAFDFGILGLGLILLLIAPLLKFYLSFKSGSNIVDVAPMVGLFLILFYTTTAFPMPWLMIAVGLSMATIKVRNYE